MFEHLDDAEVPHAGALEMAHVLRRADLIRTKRRWVLVIGFSCALLAASVGFFVARTSATSPTTTTGYEFNLRRGTLPVGFPVPTTALVAVQFANPEYGFALAVHRGAVFLAATTDGGGAWEVRNDHLPSGLGAEAGYPGQFEFVGFTGYLWGARTPSAAPLWVTHDDGATWHKASVGPYVVDVSAIGLNVWAITDTCPSTVTADLVSCSAAVEESTDGGSTWSPLSPMSEGGTSPTAAPPQPVELARITATRAYVLRMSSDADIPFAAWQLAFTSDNGATWVNRPAPCTGPVAAGAEIAASSSDDLWLLCGSQASAGFQSKELFRSRNGGQSWVLVSSAGGVGTPAPPSPVPNAVPLAGYVAPLTIGHHNLAVASPTTAWLYPSRADLYLTTDGGSTWLPVPDLTSAGFADGGAGNITFLDAEHGWICEYGVGLWHTTDGVHWSALGT